jgi:hypothetical protein
MDSMRLRGNGFDLLFLMFFDVTLLPRRHAVIPAACGNPSFVEFPWIPAFAGMTGWRKCKINGILLLIRGRKTAKIPCKRMRRMELPGNGFDLLFLMFFAIS